MFRCCAAQRCHNFLHHGPNIRFIHQITSQKTPPRPPPPTFKRDDLPHKGLNPLPERRRPRVVKVSRVEYPVQRRDEKKESRKLDRHSIAKPQTFERRNPSPSSGDDHDLAIDEFFCPSESVTVSSSAKAKKPLSSSDGQLPTAFTSPPLIPGILASLTEMLGPSAKPTPIQSLSIKWLLQKPPEGRQAWREYLLASETGSGKSIAYLLPMLQSLKETELTNNDGGQARSSSSNRPHNPRGLILAPTHELARQLSGFAKSLLHESKLRVMCTSQANMKSMKDKDATSRKMAEMFEDVENSAAAGKELHVTKGGHPVDVLAGTPMKVLEMVRGRGWDRVLTSEETAEDQDEAEFLGDEHEMSKPRRGRDFSAGYGSIWSRPELGLANIEWVVVDEADVLFDPDFQATTRLLLSDISAARGHPVPVVSAPELENPVASEKTQSTPTPISYPFNLILTSATIPNSLNQYLEKHHPSLIRLSSPNLHHLPKTLQTEYVSWSGGNKFADIHRRIRHVWAEDVANGNGNLSKVLVFCNKSTKVVELCAYLEGQGVKCVPMTSASEHRGRGSNRHLAGFLKKHTNSNTVERRGKTSEGGGGDVKTNPHVMVTTSLLSRGLDFSPEIKHVFIVDEPRNMVDFLHRAGRSGRAGQCGKVVIFGKLKGRGSERGRDVKRRVGTLAT